MSATDAPPQDAHAPAPRERDVEANGLRHRVLEWDGDPARTALVLHGYLDQARSFAPVAARLARAGHRVIAPDFRGHGASAWAPPGAYYHFPDYVADVAALADALAPEASCGALYVLGHSMGGTVATLYAGARASRVRALCLAEGTGPAEMPADVAPDRMKRWLDGLARPRARERKRLASLDEALDRLRATHGGAVPEPVLRRVAAELTAPHPSGEGLAWRFDPLHQTTSPSRFDAEVFAAFARRVTARVLVVDAGASGMTSHGVEARAALFAGARRVTIEGAGHMMHWTEPAALADVVAGFFAETA